VVGDQALTGVNLNMQSMCRRGDQKRIVEMDLIVEVNTAKKEDGTVNVGNPVNSDLFNPRIIPQGNTYGSFLRVSAWKIFEILGS
jgi:hypothetical protein